MEHYNKKLNISMLGHKRIPSREGGIEIVVEELSTRLVKLGHNVTCFNRSGNHVSGKKYNSRSYKEYKGIKIVDVLTINIKGLAALTASFNASILASLGKYDIVHYHAEGPSIMCFLPKLFKKKVVVTIHGLDHKREKWGILASSIIMKGEKNAVKYADEIIVLSQNEKDYFTKTYNRDTVLIPNGVNEPTIKEPNIIINKYGLNKDDYILYLGRIVPEKGIDYLIEAYKKINTNKKLVIAGGSSDTNDYYKKIKDMAINNNNIILTGFVEGEELEELYSNAYIYCLPSNVEGMPLSLLEAMSYGNCCLTSDLSICKDVIEDKGLTFEKGNSNDLKNKLEYLCNNINVENEYRNKSKDYICNKYNWDDIVLKTLEVYENINDK